MFNNNEKLFSESNLTHYQWFFMGKLTEQEAADLQSAAGYPPAGYGFYKFKVDGVVTKWECLKSCD